MAESSRIRLRTCIGCGRQFGKEQLQRVVRTADGTIAFDGTSRTPGRGAYVCSLDCLNKAIASKKLQRSLKAAVSKDEAEAIVNCATDVFGDDVR